MSSLHRGSRPAIKLIQAFLVGYTSSHEWYDIDIYTQRTTNLLTPIIKSFVALKMLIQNERTRWFTAQTLCSTFVQGIVRVGYSLLLLLWTLDNTDSNNSPVWSRIWPACNHECNTETCPNKENNLVQWSSPLFVPIQKYSTLFSFDTPRQNIIPAH